MSRARRARPAAVSGKDYMWDNKPEFINEGAYSAAFLIAGNRVLRVSSADNKIVSALQKELSQATEFVPKVYADFIIKRKDLPNEYAQHLPKQYNQKGSDNLTVTIMEYGGAKSKPKHVKSNTFCLLWALYTLIDVYGFQHRDIKPLNIIYSDFGDESMCFVLGQQKFGIKNPGIKPMLIDFDTAEIRDTHFSASFIRVKDYTDGTYIYLAPEYTVNPVEHVQHIGCRDVYAIGISMLETLFGEHVLGDNDGEAFKLYVDTIKQKKMRLLGGRVRPRDEDEKDENERATKQEKPEYEPPYDVFPLTFAFLKALHGTDPPKGTIDPIYWKDNEYLDIIVENITPRYEKMIGKLSANERELFSRMLHWVPEERMFQGDMYKYFSMPYFAEYANQKCSKEMGGMPAKNVWAGKKKSVIIGQLLATIDCQQCNENKATYYDDGQLKCNKCALG